MHSYMHMIPFVMNPHSFDIILYPLQYVDFWFLMVKHQLVVSVLTIELL